MRRSPLRQLYHYRQCKQSYNGCAYTIVGHFNVTEKAKNKEKLVMEAAALEVISRTDR